MRGHPLPFAVLFAFIVVPAACGGAPQDDLLAGGASAAGDGGVDTGHASSSSSGSSGGGIVTDAAAPPVDTGTGTSSGGPLDSSVVPDSSPVDTGPVGPSIYCGDAISPCTAPEVCCATPSGGNNGAAPTVDFQCTAASHCAQGSAVIECASTADCPGTEVCCGEDTNGVYSQVSCAADCTGMTSNGATAVELCDPAANDCPATMPSCQASAILTGFSVCRM